MQEEITGPTEAELRARVIPRRPFSSPMSQEKLQKHSLLSHQERTSGRLGTRQEKQWAPHHPLENPPAPEEVTLEMLMTSQAHMGHSTSLWNPMNSRYIFGVRQGTHIISLEATASYLKRAARVVEGVTAGGGTVLFVGTRQGQRDAVVKAAQLSGGCHLFTRWIPGTITNGLQLLKHCSVDAVDIHGRKIPGYEEEIREKAGVLKPDLVVCLNPLENWVLLHECALHTIPTIGIIDTDADPTWVTYPIPANDDSIRCINVIAGVLGRAGEKGFATKRKLAVNGQGYAPTDLATIAFEEKADGEDGAAAEAGDEIKDKDINELVNTLTVVNANIESMKADLEAQLSGGTSRSDNVDRNGSDRRTKKTD